MRRFGLRSPFAALILFAPLVVSCGDSGTCSGPLCDGATAALVATVAVTPATTSLTSLGATVQLQATAKDSGGNTITGKTFTWSSSNEDVVTVDTSGLTTAVAGGTATITATTDGIGGSLALTVAQTVATIEVPPVGPLTLTSMGATESLTAVAKDGGGAVVADVTFAWASDNEAAVTVAPDGTVTAVANGVANITASASGVTSNAVEVTINTTLSVTTTSLPNGALTIAYSATLAATGGDGNYTWLVASGSLPSGLNLNTSTGEISGTPTVVETQDFTVQVTSGDGQTAQQALSINVNVLPTLQPAELCSDNPASAIATFEDGNLEAVVRASLELVLGAQEDLTCGLLSGLQSVSGGFIEHGPIESLVGLQNLTSLKVLILLVNSITDISPLSGLTTLVQVQLNNNSVSDISALSELTNLTILTLAANSITNLDALSGLTSLTHLDFSVNSITDISALTGLTSLRTINLSNNSITDISALSGLPATPRTSISLGNNPDLIDIQPLLNNTGLGAGDDVELRGTMVSCEDVALLEAKGVTVTFDCVGLLVLQPSELCTENPGSAIATFEDANLEAAVRAALGVDAQDALTCNLVSGLTALDANSAGIMSLVGTQNLTSLTTLVLHHNSVSDLSPLSGLTSLTDIDLISNVISDISALSGLTSLTWLELSENAVSDLSPLSGLTSLTSLFLHGNSVNDLSPLSGLTSLRNVGFDNNSISDISALSGLTGLTSLFLGRNSITDISALSGLTSLTWLTLYDNSISDISALSGLTSLGDPGPKSGPDPDLDLSNNPNLSNIQPLLDNTGLGAGDEVFLTNTNVSCSHVAALEAKGVTVTSDCTSAAAATLSVTGITDPIIEDASSDVTVTVRSPLGNVATGYTGTIAFTSSDVLATLPANYTFVGGDAGVHTFAGGVTLASAGEQSVTATDVAVGTITGSQTEITVSLPVASVSVTPTADTILVAATTQLTAEPRDAADNPLAGRAVTWTSSDEGIVTVDATGLVAGVAQGIATITATSEGIDGTATIVVITADAVASVVVTPAGATVFVEVSTQLTAEPRDAGDNPLVGRLVTWASSNDGIATVDANGLVDGIAEGTATITATSEGVGGTAAITVQTTIFFEDFEGGVGLWSATNGIWEVGLPTSGPNGCNAGVQCAATVLDGAYPGNGNSTFRSPTIILPTIGATEELHLRFWHWFALGSSVFWGDDLGVVSIQEREGPGVWGASTQLASYRLNSGGVWTFPLIDLSAYGGLTVRILFWLDGDNSTTGGNLGWYFDDVSIQIN